MAIVPEKSGVSSHPPVKLLDQVRDRIRYIRHASFAKRLRHPYRAGIARPFRCFHHDDLHSRPQQRRQGRSEPAGQIR